MNLLLSNGNHKLPKSTLIWNLPSGLSCPKATTECKKWCYAKKAERMYPQTLPSRIRNFNISKTEGFPYILKGIINKNISDKTKQIRIHESGDIYSQKYLNDWFNVAKFFSNKIFYTYTKSYHLDYSKKPNNFIILLSDDKNKLKDYYYKFDGVTKVIEKNENNIKGFICKGDCRTCNVCYTKSKSFKNIFFRKH